MPPIEIIMNMAADSNMSFNQGIFPSSFYNQNIFSLQSGGMNGSMGMIPGIINFPGGINNTNGTILAGNSNVISTSPMIMTGGSSSNIHIDPMPSLKHDTGLAADWSLDEMAVLKAGLITFANEPNIMKYIKIAATLQDKTVRDVALRCQWMTMENGKRRKIEEHSSAKKIKDRKEKMVAPFINTNINPVSTDNISAYSFMMQQINQTNRFLCQVPVIDGLTQHLMEENARTVGEITTNLETFKIKENMHLVFQMRDNIIATLNSMSQTPGIMSQMPPLPISVNEDLVNIILSGSNQTLMFGSPGGDHLKQEPRC